MPEKPPDFAKAQSEIAGFVRNFPTVAGAEAVNHFLDAFRNQSWEGTAWPPRSARTSARSNRGRALLVDSGRLRRSVRVVETRSGYVRVGTDVPYAKIHNEGGPATMNQSVSAHRRRAHVRRRQGREIQVAAHDVAAHSRTVRIVMPRRQFMGNSPALERKIQAAAEKIIKKIIESL